MSEQPMEFWAFVENSDFQRYKGETLYRQDEISLTSHDRLLQSDYQLLKELDCVGVRDAARWYITHPAPGVFDWTWLDQVVSTAEESGIKLYLDLWHYGYPDWLDIMAPDATEHFAEFARQIALRYPSLEYYCVNNEPTALVGWVARDGLWRPFLTADDTVAFRQQLCRMIIQASEAILDVRPDAQLVLPEPWHASAHEPEEYQAAVLDTVMGLRDPELGGRPELVTIIGLNHYRDSTLPPWHQLILNARRRWPDKPLWFTETSGPPEGWQQSEWFWWMLAETRLANQMGAGIKVFTWAPIFSMFDWFDETMHLANGVWVIGENGERLPNGNSLEAIALARSYGYLR